MSTWLKSCVLSLATSLCLTVTSGLLAAEAKPAAGASGGTRIFEMRTYHAAPGKLEALHARFRDHTNALFTKHGMEMVGYWVPTDPEHGKDTLIYILAYPSMEARETAWKAFQQDPDWKKARDESEKGGKLVAKVEQVFMTPTDYSPIK